MMPICQNEYLHLMFCSLLGITFKLQSYFFVERFSFLIQLYIMLFCYLYRELGWEPISGESHLNTLSRGLVFQALATFGHDKTHKEALRRFQALVKDRNTALLSSETKKVKLFTCISNQFLIPRDLFRVDMYVLMLCRQLLLL